MNSSAKVCYTVCPCVVLDALDIPNLLFMNFLLFFTFDNPERLNYKWIITVINIFIEKFFLQVDFKQTSIFLQHDSLKSYDVYMIVFGFNDS